MVRSTVLLTILFLGLKSYAGWVVDPFVGYSTGGQLNYRYSSVNYSFNSSGTMGGLSAGYVWGNGFAVIANGSYLGGTFAAASPSGTKDDGYYRTIAGAGVGFYKGRFRLTGGYSFMNNLGFEKNKSNLNSPNAFYGTGYFATIGILAANHFAIDLRYDGFNYTTYDRSTTKGATLSNANYSSISNASYSVLLSFPFGSSK